MYTFVRCLSTFWLLKSKDEDWSAMGIMILSRLQSYLIIKLILHKNICTHRCLELEMPTGKDITKCGLVYFSIRIRFCLHTSGHVCA